jgi:hypothetical protein
MTTSINQPWAISEKYSTRYGQTWTNMDFVFEEKISAENFKTDPMNCTMGTLNVAGQLITMRYKDLITYTKAIETYTNNMYASKPKKDETFSLEIKGRNLLLVKHEIGKLNETLNDALSTSLRNYELGLYL